MPNIINNNTFTHYVVEETFDALSIPCIRQHVLSAVGINMDLLFSLFDVFLFGVPLLKVRAEILSICLPVHEYGVMTLFE